MERRWNGVLGNIEENQISSEWNVRDVVNMKREWEWAYVYIYMCVYVCVCDREYLWLFVYFEQYWAELISNTTVSTTNLSALHDIKKHFLKLK